MRSLLEKAIAAQFGSGVDVVVRSVRAWEDYIAANPFAGQADVSAKIVHLYLSRDQLNSDAAAVLEQRAQTMERIRLASGALMDRLWRQRRRRFEAHSASHRQGLRFADDRP